MTLITKKNPHNRFVSDELTSSEKGTRADSSSKGRQKKKYRKLQFYGAFKEETRSQRQSDPVRSNLWNGLD